MKITHHNGKTYRAYSPKEFFESPYEPKPIFNLDKIKMDNRKAKDASARKTNPESSTKL